MILEFFEALGVVVLIIDFIMVYKIFHPGLVSSPIIGLLITGIVTFLLFIPFPWFMWLMFFVLFLYSFFSEFKPWEW